MPTEGVFVLVLCVYACVDVWVGGMGGLQGRLGEGGVDAGVVYLQMPTESVFALVQ